MPAVRDLLRVWCTHGNAADVFGRTVTCDDLNFRMVLEPSGNGLGGTVGELLDRTMLFQIHDEGAIGFAPFERPIVNADDATDLAFGP